MNQRVQGSVCLVCGLSIIGVSLGTMPRSQKPLTGASAANGRAEAANAGFAPQHAPGGSEHPGVRPAPSASSTGNVLAMGENMTNVAPHGDLQIYSGTFSTETRATPKKFWQCTIQRLRLAPAAMAPPTSSENQEQILIQVQWRETQPWSWFAGTPSETKGQVAWYTRDAKGTITPKYVPHNLHWALPSFDFLFEPQTAHLATRNPSEEAVACQLRGISKDIRYQLDEEGEAVERIEFRSKRYDPHDEVLCHGVVKLKASNSLSADIRTDLMAYLRLWNAELTTAHDLMRSASGWSSERFDKQGFSQLIEQNYARWVELANTRFGQQCPARRLIGEGFSQSLVEPGLVRYRLIESFGRLVDLSDAGVICWNTSNDENGETIDWTGHRDRVVVMGFVSSNLPETPSVLSTLERLELDFATDELLVVAMATDHAQEPLQALHNLGTLNIPIFNGRAVVEQLNITSDGIPGILLLDRHGRARALHAWQTNSHYGTLQSQVADLLEERPFSASETLVFRD